MVPHQDQGHMSERLNIYFHEGAFDKGYCLLALRGVHTADNPPPLKRLLNLLLDIVDAQSRQLDQGIGSLAASVIKILASETENASLLPVAKAPRADFEVSIRLLDQDEYFLSCATTDHPLALEKDSLEILNGFKGNAEQLREILELVEWDKSSEQS
jgi:hypothetical protein